MIFMHHALECAKLAISKNEVPVGAIIVQNNQIIARGYNEVEHQYDPTAHAEIIAIRKACKKLKVSKLISCDIYVTLEPCAMCAQAIANCRIRRVYFGAYDLKGGGIESGAKIFSHSNCHHKPEVYGGILEKSCGEILKHFFYTKR